jgi:hypothetical protein
MSSFACLNSLDYPNRPHKNHCKRDTTSRLVQIAVTAQRQIASEVPVRLARLVVENKSFTAEGLEYEHGNAACKRSNRDTSVHTSGSADGVSPNGSSYLGTRTNVTIRAMGRTL